ncbi:MAG: lipase, partial [Clostridium sp.]
MGWGNKELFGINYWGGFSSLKDHLSNEGYNVLTPTIGPISSNWDRSCELYAYLKGGTVDYGEAHSKKHGHNRYGRTYPGAYPAIGSKSNDGTIKKIHLIGHSMGGQTARVMTQLLEKGSIEEIESTTSNISPLFKGGNSWVSSVTTLSTPHDGSPEAREQTKILSYIEQIITNVKSESGVISRATSSFDYNLDQWGVSQNKSESFKNYTKIISPNDLLKIAKDFGALELTPEGSRDLNSWVSAQDNVY